MAEIRIPTNQIPADILERLQAMIPHLGGAQSQFNDNFIPAKGIATGELSPKAAGQAMMYQSFRKSRSTNRTSPDTNHSSKAADEVDGNDSVVHACNIQPASMAAPDVMDESDIVRIFPLVNDCKPKSKNGSDVVRIFENGMDGVKRFANTSGIVRIDQDADKGEQRDTFKNSDIVRVTSPDMSGHSDVVHVNSKSDIGKSCPTIDAVRNARNSSPWTESHPPQQERTNQKCSNGRRHSSSITANTESMPRRTETPEPRLGMPGKGSSTMFYLPQPAMARDGSTTSPVMADHDRSRSHQRYSETNSSAHTNEDTDLEDDEVFSIEVLSKQCISDSHNSCNTYQKLYGTTPVRELFVPRQNSDICEPIKNRISPFRPAMMMPEMSFGDRQNTRKRLSFDENEASPAKSMFKFPSYVAQQAFQNFASSSVASTSCSLPSTSIASRNSSPSLFSHRHVSTYPYSHCGSPDYEMICGSSPNQERYQNPIEKPASSCRSPVSEMMQVLEQVSSKHVQESGGPRARIRSDGDDCRSETTIRNRGQLQAIRPRGQTFSVGRKRRLESTFSSDVDDQSTSHESLPTSQEQPDEAHVDCQCSLIKKYILQMAENAYKRIRKMDGTVEDFERFRTELATTNNLLRESIANIYSLKTICQHKTRSSSSSSSSSLQIRPS